MAYKTKAQLLTDLANIKTLNISDGKIDAVELTSVLTDLIDSLGVDTPYTMSSNAYDCNNGGMQIRTLPSNGALTISNAVAGKLYMMKKLGAYTLTLPTSELSASGSTVPVGTQWITFVYDGTDYSFNFSTYLAT